MTTHTTKPRPRVEMVQMLDRLNISTELIHQADTRDDAQGVCGPFTVTRQEDATYVLVIDLGWSNS